MSILSGILGPAINVATKAAGDYQGAQEKAAKTATQGALQRAELIKQQQQMEIQKAIQDRQAQSQAITDKLHMAQIGETEAQAQQRLYDVEHPKPQAPVFGSDDYNKALDSSERIKARYDYHPQQRIDPLSPQGVAARKDIVSAAASAKGKAKGKLLPASAVEKLASLDNMGLMAENVKSALDKVIKEGTNATGRIGGMIPTPSWVKNMAGVGGDKGKDVRAMIGNLYGTVAKERGGTALSASEIRILESYLPNENEDEATAYIKANRFIKTLKSLRDQKLKTYQSFGYGEDAGATATDDPVQGALTDLDNELAAGDPGYAEFLKSQGHTQ